MDNPNNPNTKDNIDENFVDPEKVAKAAEDIAAIFRKLTIAEQMAVFRRLMGRE